ncbi:MAG: hypothetical protein IJW21_08840, partial [Clostridia bacterium]|nr:hypothetical protein [Clostridia bacterium]
GKIGLPQRERMLGVTFAGTENIYAVLWEGEDRYLYLQKCEYNGKEFEIQVKPARSYSAVADFLAKKYSLWETEYNDSFREFYHGGVRYYVYQAEGRNPEMLVVSEEGYQFVSLRIPGGEKLTLNFIKQFKPYSCNIKNNAETHRAHYFSVLHRFLL